MVRQRIQLALLHSAATITFVPIESALNRVMITELGLPATLVSLLVVFPFFLSPLQVVVGSFSDRHAVLGRRRTPYILLGLVLCSLGLVVSPAAAYAFSTSTLAGTALSVLAFGAWGMGFNLATVSYFALAAELSGEKGRGRTVATMFFLMVISIILTSVILSRMLEPYSAAALSRAFMRVAAAALLVGLLGVAWLEPRGQMPGRAGARFRWGERFGAVSGNRDAVFFFVYLLTLLAPLLIVNTLLPPFGAAAFSMSVKQSTGISSVWGTFTLVSLVAAAALERIVSRGILIRTGSAGAAAGFLLLVAAGYLSSRGLFYGAVSLLGFATGAATVANMSFMLEMTVPGKVGLFMGAWGTADAIARLCGNLVSGVVRDVAAHLFHAPVAGYAAVCTLLALLLVASLFLLPRVDLARFRQGAS
jgi:BCD family chlorophyll transporter-like MFS transporter